MNGTSHPSPPAPPRVRSPRRSRRRRTTTPCRPAPPRTAARPPTRRRPSRPSTRRCRRRASGRSAPVSWIASMAASPAASRTRPGSDGAATRARARTAPEPAAALDLGREMPHGPGRRACDGSRRRRDRTTRRRQPLGDRLHHQRVLEFGPSRDASSASAAAASSYGVDPRARRAGQRVRSHAFARARHQQLRRRPDEPVDRERVRVGLAAGAGVAAGPAGRRPGRHAPRACAPAPPSPGRRRRSFACAPHRLRRTRPGAGSASRRALGATRRTTAAVAPTVRAMRSAPPVRWRRRAARRTRPSPHPPAEPRHATPNRQVAYDRVAGTTSVAGVRPSNGSAPTTNGAAVRRPADVSSSARSASRAARATWSGPAGTTISAPRRARRPPHAVAREQRTRRREPYPSSRSTRRRPGSTTARRRSRAPNARHRHPRVPDEQLRDATRERPAARVARSRPRGASPSAPSGGGRYATDRGRYR